MRTPGDIAYGFGIQRRICTWPWHQLGTVARRFNQESGDLAQLRLSLLRPVHALLILLITGAQPRFWLPAVIGYLCHTLYVSLFVDGETLPDHLRGCSFRT